MAGVADHPGSAGTTNPNVFIPASCGKLLSDVSCAYFLTDTIAWLRAVEART